MQSRAPQARRFIATLSRVSQKQFVDPEPRVPRVHVQLALVLLAAGCEAGREMNPQPTIRTPVAGSQPSRAVDEFDALRNSEFQAALEALDRRVADALGIPVSDRAFGVLDLGEKGSPAQARLASIHEDQLFYGAS